MENDIRETTNGTRIRSIDELKILLFVSAELSLCYLDWFRLPTLRFLLCSYELSL